MKISPIFPIDPACACACADIYIQVNGHIMKPLEEYMLFTKSGADNITVINPQGVRSAQCNAKFDVSEQPTQEPMVNVSMVRRTVKSRRNEAPNFANECAFVDSCLSLSASFVSLHRFLSLGSRSHHSVCPTYRNSFMMWTRKRIPPKCCS